MPSTQSVLGHTAGIIPNHLSSKGRRYIINYHWPPEPTHT